MQMNMAQQGHHQRMLAAYDFGLFPLPCYREHRLGAWRLVRHLPSLADGYVSPTMMESGRHVLYHRRTPWMSTGLLEWESHAYHVHAAHGAVVVAGLGLAMYAHAVAAKASVDRVVVIERSADVINLMRIASGWDTWPERGKIIILEADALDPALAGPVRVALDGRAPDYLFADIWPRCAQAQTPIEMAAMVRAFRPVSAGWWGQELGFAAWCDHDDPSGDLEAKSRSDLSQPVEVTPARLEAYFDNVGVPVPLTPGYVAFCRDVIAMNRPPQPSAVFSIIGRLWRGFGKADGRDGSAR